LAKSTSAANRNVRLSQTKPELTAETIVDGWLRTGDLGKFDAQDHLHLSGRKKNMIVTEEGKNIYPEDIEAAFEGLAAEDVKEFCVFAANYIWPKRSMVGEQLIIVVHLESGHSLTDQLKQEIIQRNHRLAKLQTYPWASFSTTRLPTHCIPENQTQRTRGTPKQTRPRPSYTPALVPMALAKDRSSSSP